MNRSGDRRDGPRRVDGPRREGGTIEIRRDEREPREPRRERNPKDVELPKWNPSNGPVS